MPVQLRLVQRQDRGDRVRAAATALARRVSLRMADAPELVATRSIGAFDPDEWNALFVGDPEDWAYHRAIESVGPAQFSPLYLAIRDGRRLLAAVPAHIGPGPRNGARRSWSELVTGRAPRSRLVLGSPVSDTCRMGFAEEPGLDGRAALARLLVQGAWDLAQRSGVGTLAIEGTGDDQFDLWSRACAPLRLSPRNSSPVARLHLPAWAFEDYLSALPNDTRDELLRACARADQYRVEWNPALRSTIPAILNLCRSAGRNGLYGALFSRLLDRGAKRASYATYSVNGELVAANLLLHDSATVLDKLTVVHPHVPRRSTLSQVIWLESVRHCLERGARVFQSSSSVSFACAHAPDELARRCNWVQPTIDQYGEVVDHAQGLPFSDEGIVAL